LKRYNTFSEHLKRTFGTRVQRISIDAGFSCPNRDGSLDVSGCIFCGAKGSGSHGIRADLPVALQIEDAKEIMRRKYHAQRFIAYFQAYSNTYATPSRLCALYDEALSVNDVVGLMVATRPDCLSESIMDVLEQYSQSTYFWLEVGMQSIHDRSLDLLNRRHSYATVCDAIQRAKRHGMRICVHVILGLPGESRADMLAMASELNRLEVDGIKIHMLHVMKGTRLAEMYDQGEVRMMPRNEYVPLVCDFLERLNPEILIHRLTGDGGHDNLVAPLWSLKKFEVLNQIDAEMAARGTKQGQLFDPGAGYQ